MPELHNWTVKKLLIVLLFFVLFAGIWQCINSPMVVTVSGTGEVSVPATNAIISFSVSSTDSSIQTAISNTNAKALAIRELLKSKGVAEGDIAESQVATAPGFTATITMAAKTTHVSDMSTLISDLYRNGVSVVSQPILSVEDQDKLEDEAFTLAMKDAKTEAKKVGRANWKFIKKLVGVAQSTSSNTSTATTKADTLTEANSAVAAENGVFKIVKTVSATYKFW